MTIAEACLWLLLPYRSLWVSIVRSESRVRGFGMDARTSDTGQSEAERRAMNVAMTIANNDQGGIQYAFEAYCQLLLYLHDQC